MHASVSRRYSLLAILQLDSELCRAGFSGTVTRSPTLIPPQIASYTHQSARNIPISLTDITVSQQARLVESILAEWESLHTAQTWS